MHATQAALALTRHGLLSSFRERSRCIGGSEGRDTRPEIWPRRVVVTVQKDRATTGESPQRRVEEYPIPQRMRLEHRGASPSGEHHRERSLGLFTTR